ncbi:MAG: TOMM precursor leader peptide-binding protein [Xenococcaceae cyanobacterium MO_234.B1]|nr:TOMM precursor leader peptide-binding protein [Xenococcaceae cyanobacterium MO_234.B1]
MNLFAIAWDRINTLGYIINNEDNLPLGVAAFWDLLNVERSQVVDRLQSTKVSVTACGNVATEPLINILQSLKIQVGEAGDFQVVLTDDYLQGELDLVNQKAIESQKPWMLVKPVGTTLWIGPIFQPGITGCWQCLAQRLRANRPVETFLERQKDVLNIGTTSLSVLPSTLQTGLNLAATEIAKWIVQGENKALRGSLITFDTLSLQTQNHVLVKRPQCTACGEGKEGSHSEASPLLLQSRQKTFTEDGGGSCLSPEKTLQRYGHHISPITGAVRGLSLLAQSNRDLTPTYIAGHNFATMFDSLYFLRENLRGRSSGKGKTDAQARASALGEAIERYSGIFEGDEPRKPGSYQEMGDVAIHPNACLLFSDRQYQTRKQWNHSCSSFFQKVPEPFDEEREREWTPVWSLTHQEFKYLPTAYCYYGYPQPDKPDCWADSNGTAAGNTREEAILQGFMELVERDSVALWWYNRLKRPAVDLDSFESPYFQSLKEYYGSLNRELWVLDLTSDLQIPAFVALSRRRDSLVEDIIYGFGAHFEPQLGIMRALTELTQILPAVISVNEDGSTQYCYSDSLALDWWQQATLQNQPYLIKSDRQPAKTAQDYPQLATDDLLEDINKCVEIAQKNGLGELDRKNHPMIRHYPKRYQRTTSQDQASLLVLDLISVEPELQTYPFLWA